MTLSNQHNLKEQYQILILLKRLGFQSAEIKTELLEWNVLEVRGADTSESFCILHHTQYIAHHVSTEECMRQERKVPQH